MIAAIACLSAAEPGARPSSLKLTPGLISGRTGHPQFSDGRGISGISPSPSLIPGQLPLVTLSDICSSSALLAGNSMKVYFSITPRAALLALEIWHTILVQNFPIPCCARLADRIGAAAPPLWWHGKNVYTPRREGSPMSAPHL